MRPYRKRSTTTSCFPRGVTNHLVTLATLGDSPWGLKVDYRVALLEDGVFSAVINAQGKMPDGHEGQAYSAPDL